MTEPLLPGTDIVSVAWLKLIAGLPADRISTKLPADDALIRDPGFVTTTVVGGSPAAGDMPWRQPVVSCDCWAAPAPGSEKVPWGVASQLAERIVNATYDRAYLNRRIDFTGPLAVYAPARVATVMAITEPRRIPDPSGVARFSVDLLVHWRIDA